MYILLETNIWSGTQICVIGAASMSKMLTFLTFQVEGI